VATPARPVTAVLVLTPTTDCIAVVNRLHDNNWLDPAITANDTADTSYALSRPEVYPMLRKQRRLPHSRYAGWLAGTLTAALRTADSCTGARSAADEDGALLTAAAIVAAAGPLTRARGGPRPVPGPGWRHGGGEQLDLAQPDAGRRSQLSQADGDNQPKRCRHTREVAVLLEGLGKHLGRQRGDDGSARRRRPCLQLALGGRPAAARTSLFTRTPKQGDVSTPVAA